MSTRRNYKNKESKRVWKTDVSRNPLDTKTHDDFDNKYRERLIDWATFYRRNVPRFVQHYFGIKLYAFEQIWLYAMSISNNFVSICSRATGKTWLLAVLACARAVLYPGSKVVVVASTKDQAGKLITEKIRPLYNDHPNLAREISDIVTNLNRWEVTFHNGSTIVVVAARDSSRGNRSNFSIFEEFRLIPKTVVDSVIRPFSVVRQPPYRLNPKYEKIDVLKERSKNIFISSAYHKGEWWFSETKQTIKALLLGESAGFIACDLAPVIRHGIKTEDQIKDEMSRVDEITKLEEYLNIPFGESSAAYFRLKYFQRARNIKKAFYPQREENFNPKKNPYGIPKTEGEIRLLSCDVAQRVGARNDLSISSNIRLLPTHKGYFRELSYMESFSGVDSITQALRIKRLYYDFECDYLVLDVASGGGGLPIYDQLGQVTKDDERGVEYPAFTIMVHDQIDSLVYEELSKRTLGINALPVIFPISASAKLNSIIAVEFRNSLQRKMWGFLVDESTAEDILTRGTYSKEFLDNDDVSAKARFLAPFVQTSLFTNESISLSMSLNMGNLKLEPPSGGRKDRYSSVSYGNLLASYFDAELLKQYDNSNDFEELLSLVQTTRSTSFKGGDLIGRR